MASSQPSILADVPAHARYLRFRMEADADVAGAVAGAAPLEVDDRIVVGGGSVVVSALDARLD